MFHFQQFSIRHENASMKVGTDGVLLGAWTPLPDQESLMLDVGTGTGLIALMLAQRAPRATVHGVEFDDMSCRDARHNFEKAPWDDRLHLYETSFQDFYQTRDPRYHLIVCNPPFFSQSLHNPCHRKANARHNHALSHEELLTGSEQLLLPDGMISLILPFDAYESFRSLAARTGWFEYRRLMVRPSPRKPVKRVLSLWGKRMPCGPLESDEMIVEWARHHFSEEFRNLTSEFYLNKPLDS